MPHQDKSQKCYLDQGINLEWPNCLRRGHESRNCYTKMSCKTCGQNHASCLHNVNKTGQSV